MILWFYVGWIHVWFKLVYSKFWYGFTVLRWPVSLWVAIVAHESSHRGAQRASNGKAFNIYCALIKLIQNKENSIYTNKNEKFCVFYVQ